MVILWNHVTAENQCLRWSCIFFHTLTPNQYFYKLLTFLKPARCSRSTPMSVSSQENIYPFAALLSVLSVLLSGPSLCCLLTLCLPHAYFPDQSGFFAWVFMLFLACFYCSPDLSAPWPGTVDSHSPLEGWFMLDACSIGWTLIKRGTLGEFVCKIQFRHWFIKTVY